MIYLLPTQNPYEFHFIFLWMCSCLISGKVLESLCRSNVKVSTKSNCKAKAKSRKVKSYHLPRTRSLCTWQMEWCPKDKPIPQHPRVCPKQLFFLKSGSEISALDWFTEYLWEFCPCCTQRTLQITILMNLPVLDWAGLVPFGSGFFTTPKCGQR